MVFDNSFQPISQSFGDFVEFNQTAALKFNVGFSQIFEQSFAKLIGATNAFSGEEREYAGRVLIGLLADDILLSRPCSIPNSIQSIPEICEHIRIYVVSEQ